MVKLEEVEDQELDQAQPGPVDDSAYDSADFTDTDSELSDDDTFSTLPQESISERISALRDILPPRHRRTLTTALSRTSSAVKQTSWFAGKGLWVLSTGALMLMVPFAIALFDEQQIVEQEKEIKAQEQAREGIMGRSEGAAAGAGAGAVGGGEGGKGL
ncbi:mitochondrial import receptor subunit Tom22 [Lecanora helva]